MSATRWAIKVAVVALLYYGAASLGLPFAFEKTNASPVWPSSGVAFAAVLWLGYRVWPGIALGAFLANVVAFLTTRAADPGTILAVSSVISVGNTLEAVSGAWLLRHRFAGSDYPFDRAQDVFKFVAVALLMCTVSASVGPTAVALAGLASSASYATVWFTWWLGDAIGVLVVTPVLLTWRRQPWIAWMPRRYVEAVLLFVVLFLAGRLGFGGWLLPKDAHYPLPFLPIPVLVWAAFRFGPREAATAAFVTSGIAVWDTIHGFGPFVRATVHESLLLLQAFVGIVTATILTMAAVVAERRAVQATLRTAHDELERRVHERTQELARLTETLRAEIAERKRASEARGAAEERFRRLLELAPDAIVIVNREGRMVFVNSQAETMFGYARDELLGQLVELLLPERVRQRHAGHRAHYTANPRLRPMGAGLELLARRKDGSEFPVEISLSPVETGEGLVIASAIRDITERKQVQEAIRQSEAGFRLLFANNPQPMWVYDLETLQFLEVNEAAVAHYGYSRDLFLEMRITDIRPTEDVPYLLEHVARERPDLQHSGQWRHRLRDGRVIDVEITSHTLEFAGRRAALIIAADITERRKAEQALRDRARQQAAVAELGQLALTTRDLSELMDRAVRLVADTLGMEYCKVLELVPGGDMLLLRAGWGWREGSVGHATVPAGTESQAGYTLQSGEPVIVEDLRTETRFSGPPLLREHGVVSGLSVIIRGREGPFGVLGAHTTTHRIFTGDDSHFLQAIANVLAAVLQRVGTEDALRQSEAQRLQLQKMEAVGRLAGGIAHDFNNLLTVIMGRCRILLLRLGSEDPLRREVELIGKTAEGAARLTKQVLAFGRKQMLQPIVLDLNAAVATMSTMLERLIGEDIELVFVPAPELGRVKADPAQLEQVIVNLAANARDAMPHGGRLTLETANVKLDERHAKRHPGVTPGQYVMLAVSDTGIGMDQPTLSRLFEPFFTTKEVGKGTGLGLATVYGIVKQSGGNVWVYSEPGQGTTFKLYLPRVEESPATEEPREVVVERLSGTETVLVVEDDDEVRALAREILVEYGYTVLQARHPVEAMVMAERHEGPIHLLLTDVVMPQMSGWQLTAQLSPLRPEMKVLYMSGYAENAIVKHGMLEREVRLLPKPFTPDALATKVREVLAESQA